MKVLFRYTMISLVLLSMTTAYSFGQGINGKPKKRLYKGKSIPTYFMAKDANPVVFVSFKDRMNGSMANNFATYEYETKEASNPPYEHQDAPVIDVKNIIYDDFAPRLKSKLEDIGVNPAAIVNFGDFKSANVFNNYVDNRMRNILHENKSRCIINVSVFNYPKKRKVKKDRSKDKHYKHVGMTIHRYEGGSVYYDYPHSRGDYFVGWYDLDEMIENLSSAINTKSAYYFQDTIPGKPYYEKQDFEPYRIHFTLPDDLDEQTLFIPNCPYERRCGINELYQEKMAEIYPYEWKLVENQGTYNTFQENIGGQYIMEGRYEANSFTEFDYSSFNEVETHSGTRVYYYFVVKDMESGDSYFGTNEFEKTQYSEKAIENFVKLVDQNID